MRAIFMPKELVAATDGEQRRPVLDGGGESLSLVSLQVVGNRDLLLVLTTAPKEAVDGIRD